MDGIIKVGARIYLRNCIAGEPGVVVGFDRRKQAEVFWPDLCDEIGRTTFHPVDTLVIDEAFTVKQLDLFDLDAVAA